VSNNHVHPTMQQFLWFAPPEQPKQEAVPAFTEEQLLAGDLERLQLRQKREQERIDEVTQQELDALRRQGLL
jgi:hypothetical protein